MLDKIPDLQNIDVKSFDISKTPAAGNFTFNLPYGFVFQPTYIQAGLIVFLIFLLILTLGSLRHRMAHWEFRGLFPGIAFGFVLALILEGIMLVGGGTLITKTLGWKNAPKPISVALDQGKEKLNEVLGEKTSQVQEELTPQEVLQGIKNLSPSEYDSIKRLICEE